MKRTNFINKKISEQSGITLVALVVTIIVLLILAGVTIVTLTGDNGLLTKAGQAKNASEQANLEEEVQLALIEGQTDKYFNSNSNIQDKLKSIFEKSYGQGNIDVTKAGKNYKVKVKNTKTAYRIKSDGTVEKYEEMDPTPVYARLDDDGTLYMRATKPDNNYKVYIDSSSIQTNWESKTPESIIQVIIEEDIAPSTGVMMFYNYINLTEIQNIQKVHTENINDTTWMFCKCDSLTHLDVSNFDTSNVKDMSAMFYNCKNLNTLDLSSFDTSKTGTFYETFTGCKALKELDLSGFNTSNVSNMCETFMGCSSLELLEISSFDTSKVTNFQNMFFGCSSLKSINLNGFNTEKAKDMSYMFYGCTSLKELDVSNFYTNNVTNMSAMFCSLNIETIDISNFNTENVMNMQWMFSSCTKLKKLYLKKFVINNDKYEYFLSNVPSNIKIQATQITADKIITKSDLTINNFEIIE